MLANIKLSRIRSTVFLLSCRHATTSSRSFRISTTWAASTATSVPAAIAIPTSACASAGESFTPSPTIATRIPLLWYLQVDTFPVHCQLSFSTSPLNSGYFMRRQHFCIYLGDSHLSGDTDCGLSVIASQKNHLQSHFFQRINCQVCLGFHHVCHANHGYDRA